MNHPATGASSSPGRIHRTSTVLSPPMTEFPGGPVRGVVRGCSDTLDCLEAPGPDCLDELLVVLLVLVGVAFAEVGDLPGRTAVAANTTCREAGASRNAGWCAPSVTPGATLWGVGSAGLACDLACPA